MARKGWDALSDKYRNRLLRNGINQQAYESGAALHAARGKGSAGRESFSRFVSRFLHSVDAPPESAGAEKQRIMAMGPFKGRAYITERRAMVRAYERGDYPEAQSRFARRDQTIHGVMYRLRRSDGRIVDATWWYHGIFGG